MPFLPEDIVTRYWAGLSHPRLPSEAVFEVEEESRGSSEQRVRQLSFKGTRDGRGIERHHRQAGGAEESHRASLVGVARDRARRHSALVNPCQLFVPAFTCAVLDYHSVDGTCKISRMSCERADSLLARLYTRLSMWWLQRTERRLAMRRYRLEKRVARRLQ